MSSSIIPFHLTVGRTPSEGPQAGAEVAIVGPELTKQMVRYLDSALRGWSIEERIAQLEDVDSRVYRAYCLHRAKHSTERIAAAMRVSLRTAQRLVKCGQDFVTPPEWENHRNPDVRLAWLQGYQPDVAMVLDLRSHGYSLQQVADEHGLSLEQVKRLSARGRAVMGPRYWQVSTFRRRRDDREEISTEEIAARDGYRAGLGQFAGWVSFAEPKIS